MLSPLDYITDICYLNPQHQLFEGRIAATVYLAIQFPMRELNSPYSSEQKEIKITFINKTEESNSHALETP